MADLPNGEAFPALEKLLRFPNGASAEVTSARLALAQRTDLGIYYFARLKTLFDADSPETDAEMKALFRFLATVPSDEAIMVMAAFVETNSRRERKASNPDEVTPDEAAARTLGGLHLSDYPVHKPPASYTSDDNAAWRDWLAACSALEWKPTGGDSK